MRLLVRAAAAMGAAWLTLFAAVTMALIVPATTTREGPERVAFDYPGQTASLAPLSPEYLARLRGEKGTHGVDREAVLQGARRGSTNPRLSGGSVGLPADRVVVDHALVHDHHADAIDITSIPYSSRTVTTRATRSEDPIECGAAGGTVWYRYTAPADIGLVAFTYGSDHAVSLGVFQQGGGGWSMVACDVDDRGNALTTFAATKGATYYFQVGAPNGGGRLRFQLDPRGTIDLVSASAGGEQGDSASSAAPPSSSFRRVALMSYATNLTDQSTPRCPVNQLTNDRRSDRCAQVYLRDLGANGVRIASTSSDGSPGNGDSGIGAGHALSGNGRYLAFESKASNLHHSGAATRALFVKDLVSGSVDRVSPAPTGAPTPGEDDVGWFHPSLSDDGRVVAFQSSQSLVASDTNDTWDVYTFDRVTRRYQRASRTQLRAVPRDASTWLASADSPDLTPVISPDGRFVHFRHPARDIVTEDTNETWDTFVFDRWTGRTERISVSTRGEQANAPSTGQHFLNASFSADSRYVVFDSLASNLTPDDTPGTLDVFLHDRHRRTTERIGITVADTSPATPHNASISRNGRFVTYTNWGIDSRTTECDGFDSAVEPDSVIAGDAFECTGHVFVYDRLTDVTFPVTVLPTGEQWWGMLSTVSDDGSRVLFHSYGTDAGERRSPPLQVFLYTAARPF